jgi:adenylate cyclase
MTAPQMCRSCGATPGADARFCAACGAPIAVEHGPAEYKQVTVLFADVVHSMDIAAAVGPERLREIMAELVDRAVAVVKRYGGTVDKFTGDGIMAVFGAPVAYEDHAARACLAALGIQEQAAAMAAGVVSRDGIDLRLRIGLNSGQVIAGEIGTTSSVSLGYTTIGEHVGLAQRMESVAPPGGVTLSDSTARIVEDVAVLALAEMVYIKGAAELVPAHRLLAVTGHRELGPKHASTLVGREWEVGALSGMLHRSVGGHGCVVDVVGPPGIGKSRLAAETISMTKSLGVEVFSTFCESHADGASPCPDGLTILNVRSSSRATAMRGRERASCSSPSAAPSPTASLCSATRCAARSMTSSRWPRRWATIWP